MNTRNKISITLFSAALLAANIASADHRSHRGHSDNHYRGAIMARVIESSPIYETVRVSRPEKTCWTEQASHPRPFRSEYRERSYTSPIIGGIIGGVIGNRFGHGRGNTAMTVAGTALGASIGNDLGRIDRPARRHHGDTEKHCETVNHYEYREEIVGYDVKYRYRGKTYQTQTDEHPGKRIPVNVSVRPVRYY